MSCRTQDQTDMAYREMYSLYRQSFSNREDPTFEHPATQDTWSDRALAANECLSVTSYSSVPEIASHAKRRATSCRRARCRKSLAAQSMH